MPWSGILASLSALEINDSRSSPKALQLYQLGRPPRPSPPTTPAGAPAAATNRIGPDCPSKLGNGTALRHSCRTAGPTPPPMTFRLLFALCLWLTSFVAAPLRADEAPAPAPAEATPPRHLDGEIIGARWTALVPANWNGRLLLEAPDRISAPAPLVAPLEADTPEHQALLTAGWAIATTTYRRTGPILVDAIDDLRALRGHLAAELGEPKIVLVDGLGMGGLIATIIAERHADEFHGCLARDPKFDARDPRALRFKCDHQPRGPLFFLFGLETAPGVIAYQERARAVANAESYVPVLWFQPAPADADPAAAPVTHLGAIEALTAWVQTRQMPAARLENLPAVEEPSPESEAAKEHVAPAEAPLLPDEPPPSVPVD